MILFSILCPIRQAGAGGSMAICQTAGEQAQVAALDAFLEQSLVEHGRYSFTRDLKIEVKKKAQEFLQQRILDKRAEYCGFRLKVAEETKSRVGCPVRFLDPYMHALAVCYDDNKKMLEERRREHIKILQRKLFEIASGSTLGLEGITYRGYALVGAPKALKVEWLKTVAGELGAEIHKVWGAVEAEKNLLVRDNANFAREAISTKQEIEAAKVDGRCAS